MKLEIYDEKQGEKVVRLRLKSQEDGEIVVLAVNESGKKLSQGNLVGFLLNGQILQYPGVNPDLGFDLDKDERIRHDDQAYFARRRP